tara:strand:+ start:222 stop:641 length:420 start_codon:yes stop_codon:yes gene_type:complete
MIAVYIHLLSTVFMMGLIWFVQVVHYPLFHKITSYDSSEYALEHQRLTAWVVGLPMLLEGVTAIWLFFDPVDGRFFPFIGGVLLLVVHLSTVFLQVPMHSKLLRRFSILSINRLVKSNWIRTAGWTLRSLVAVLIVASA